MNNIIKKTALLALVAGMTISPVAIVADSGCKGSGSCVLSGGSDIGCPEAAKALLSTLTKSYVDAGVDAASFLGSLAYNTSLAACNSVCEHKRGAAITGIGLSAYIGYKFYKYHTHPARGGRRPQHIRAFGWLL